MILHARDNDDDQRSPESELHLMMMKKACATAQDYILVELEVSNRCLVLKKKAKKCSRRCRRIDHVRIQVRDFREFLLLQINLNVMHLVRCRYRNEQGIFVDQDLRRTC